MSRYIKHQHIHARQDTDDPTSQYHHKDESPRQVKSSRPEIKGQARPIQTRTPTPILTPLPRQSSPDRPSTLTLGIQPPPELSFHTIHLVQRLSQAKNEPDRPNQQSCRYERDMIPSSLPFLSCSPIRSYRRNPCKKPSEKQASQVNQVSPLTSCPCCCPCCE